MVAYGLPVIHQSLATAPLDIKEAIDWLIRIGGKDVKDEGNDKTGELLKVAKRCFQLECNAVGPVNAIGDMEKTLKSLVEELAKFIGYEFNGDGSYGHRQLNGSGIGRRGGHSILSDVSKGGFLLCCKDESACTSLCKCCQNGNVDGGAKCNPNNCPIKKVLECSITLIGMCGEKGDRHPNSSKDNAYVCCIISFLITCFSDSESLDHSSIQCKHCDGFNLHKECHKDCKCKHKRVISKVSCRINCLIQLANTLNTLYSNKNAPMCRTCQYCNVCNPPRESNKCNPCSECNSALKGNREHCEYCRTGQCCIDNKGRNAACQSRCEKCPNCSIVRNAKAFWDMLDHVSYSCGKCTKCLSTSSTQERKKCPTCSVCPGDSCNVGCKNRKRFGNLISELLHFMVYNFGDVAYALKGNISRLKDDCCKQRGSETECQCSKACCGSFTPGPSDCEDCKLYCICCAEKGEGCSGDNKCSEKLELLVRPALSGYVSAYDYNIATWDTLRKKEKGKNTCSDQCTESCQCSSTDCPAEGCCTHCPKRQCANILCMVVPAIYWFFKYVKKHIEDEQNNSDGINTSQWADGLITGDTHLGEVFRSCGFHSNRLKPRMGCQLLQTGHVTSSGSCRSRDHKPGNLKELLSSCKTLNKGIVKALHWCNINSNISKSYGKPQTVREKVLWLCGLPYSDVYEDLQRTFVASMANVSSNLSMMQFTLRLCVFPFHIFEDGSQSVWQYISHGFAVPGSKQRLVYNRNLIQLLWDMYDTLYDVTCALTFINKQCTVSNLSCGWQECKFGKNVNVNGDAGDVCQCQTGRCNATCNHCSSVCKACRPRAKCVCCCPHCEQRPDKCTCLMRFITDNGSMTDASHASPFCSERYGQMGFSQGSLRKVEMRGAALYDCMSGLISDDHTIFSRFLESLLIARAGVPENLSDYYALFLGLGMRLHMESHQNGATDKTLLKVFKTSMRNAFLGAHDALMQPVVLALRQLYKEDSGHTSSGNGHTDGNIHNGSDLASLYGCYNGTACVGYMYALSSGPYELFSRYAYNGTDEFASLSTNWVLCGASAFYNLMKNITAEVHMLECCKGDSCTCNSIISNTCECTDCNCFCQDLSSGCYCGTIIKCKAMHPLLYRFGFTFHEPDMWSSPKRKCKDFSDTMSRLIGRDSMLCQLIEAIENFLWQIRLPFCIALLTLWATAFCFLMYVFIGYLDRLGMRSRWLSRKPIAHPIQFFTSSMVKPMGGGGGAVI